jgi:hypothetical protein
MRALRTVVHSDATFASLKRVLLDIVVCAVLWCKRQVVLTIRIVPIKLTLTLTLTLNVMRHGLWVMCHGSWILRQDSREHS